MTMILKGARVIDPSQNLNTVADILIENGRIKKFAPDLKDQADSVIDCNGCTAAPGFIDMHVHFRDPGFEYKEDIISGAEAAVRGGFTGVACMANTSPVADSVEVVSYIREKGAKTPISVYPIAAMTKGLKGEEICDFKALKAAGAVAVSDDGCPVRNSKMTLDVLMEAQKQELLSISHCEDKELVDGGVINDGEVSKKLGVKGISNMSEYLDILRNAVVAEKDMSRLHIAHVSCRESVDVIRLAKQRNPNLTCETAPHYISLDDNALLRCGVNAKMNPPLRTRADMEALIEALCDGTIDAIATDHAPHSESDKGTIEKGAFGIVGLETAFAVCYTYLVASKRMGIERLVELMSTKPAEILGVEGGSLKEGKRADIVVFDTGEYVVDKTKFASKSKNTPFDGMTLNGRIRYTISNGEIAYKNEEI